MRTKELRKKIERLKGNKEQIQKDLSSLKKGKRLSERALKKHEKAKEVIREIGLKTQQQLQYHIGDITSLALESVFPNPYQLELEFIQRRNKTECDIYFSKDDKRTDPLSASGGGVVDIAAFALRIASWSLQKVRTRNLIILDEPMRFVSEDLMDKASAMLKEVSQKLNIQFIVITHEPLLANYADRVFQVKNKKGISSVS